MADLVPESEQQYGSILTVLGESAEQNGKMLKKPVEFTHIAFGDANDTYVQPDRKAQSLVNELYRIPVNSVDVLQPTPDSVPILKVEALIPDDIHDVVIREFAAVATFNGQSYFHAVGNCARVYVPNPVNNGQLNNPVSLEMTFVITSAEPIVEMDPNVITASRNYVNTQVSKSDERVAQALIDQNGKDWFIGDGFQVLPKTDTSVAITPGAGYVSGNRVSLGFERIISVPAKPAYIYLDANREGTPTGEQITTFNFVVSAEEKDDYIDTSTGKQIPHFVCKIAQVLEDGSVSDLRPEGEISRSIKDAVPNFAYSTFGSHLRSSQERFKDAINIKDFGAIGSRNDDTESFMAAAEFVKTNGKYKTIYAPADDYRCDKPIVLWNGSSLIGDGRNSTSIFNSDPTSKTEVETLSPVRQLERNVNCNVALFSSSQGYSYNSQVKELRLEGPEGSSSDGSGKLAYSIYAPEISHMDLKALYLTNARHGFWSYNSWMCTLEEVTAKNVFGWGFAVASDGSGRGGSTSTTFKRCWTNFGGGGFYLYGMNYSDMTNCGADHIGMTGYDELPTSPYFFHLCNGLTASGCGSEDIITSLVYNVVSGHVNLNNPTIQNWRPDRNSSFKALIKNAGAHLTVTEGQSSLLKVSRNDPGELYSIASVSEGSPTQVIGGFCDRAVDEQLVKLNSVFHGGGFEALGSKIKLRNGFNAKTLDYGLLSLLGSSWSSGSGDGVFTKSQTVNCKSGDSIDVPVNADIYKIRDAFARLVTADESRGVRVEVTNIYHSPEEYNRVRVWFLNADGTTNYQSHDIVLSSIFAVK
ncbi:TPA: phage tail protein [Vibrio vulnificus]